MHQNDDGHSRVHAQGQARADGLRRRQFGCLAAAGVMGLAGTALPARAQLFGRTAGLAPLLLGQGLPQPPTRAFEVSGRTSLAKRVVLGSFTLSVVQQHVRLVPATGLAVGIAEAGTQFADLQLQGLDSAALQAAADSVYAAWLDAGRNAGLDMVTLQALQTSSAWAAVRATGLPSGAEQLDRGIATRNYAPAEMVVNGIGQAPADSGLPLPTGGVADALAKIQGQAREVAALARAARSGQALEPLAKALGAQLLSVRLVVGFAEVKDELAGHPHLLSTGDGRTRLGMYLDARSSQVVLSAPDNEDSRTLTLRLPFLLPEPVFKGVDSAPPDAVNTSRAVAEALVGWRGIARSTRHLVQADGAALARQATGALAALAPAVFKALASA